MAYISSIKSNGPHLATTFSTNLAFCSSLSHLQNILRIVISGGLRLKQMDGLDFVDKFDKA